MSKYNPITNINGNQSIVTLYITTPSPLLTSQPRRRRFHRVSFFPSLFLMYNHTAAPIAMGVAIGPST